MVAPYSPTYSVGYEDRCGRSLDGCGLAERTAVPPEQPKACTQEAWAVVLPRARPHSSLRFGRTAMPTSGKMGGLLPSLQLQRGCGSPGLLGPRLPRVCMQDALWKGHSDMTEVLFSAEHRCIGKDTADDRTNTRKIKTPHPTQQAKGT